MERTSLYTLPITCILLLLGTVTFGCQKTDSDTHIIILPGDVPLEMVWIPPGSFMMGSPEDEKDRNDNEGPQHEVTIAKGFWMGKYPITQAQWQTVMENNPSQFKGKYKPVEKVSWNDIREPGGYLERLNAAYPGYNFRLPSEAEWEYAYRAGTTTRFYWGDDLDYIDIRKHAIYINFSELVLHDVGRKRPNAWGLYDMAGNVFEWCEDDWHENYLGAPNDGSAWVNEPREDSRVNRGGTWHWGESVCRAAYRHHNKPEDRHIGWGFRVVSNME